MSYKFYGRLIGKISSGDTSLSLTTPADTTTPFNPQSPGTKFMAYGEDSTSLAFNRAFGALATNIDSIAGTLGSPALRSEMLRPATATEPGFSALVIGAEQTDINLGDTPGSDTQPPVWVYCGFSRRSLGDNIKSFHIGGELPSGLSHRANLENRDESFTNYSSSPVDCSENSGASSEFGLQAFVGSEDYAIPLTVPPVRRIRSDIQPYGGVSQTISIGHWESDGLYVKNSTLDELALRAGCFVEIQNNGNPLAAQGNNGLFRVEHVSRNTDKGGTSVGSKVVLTRGNLHRVTVSDGSLHEAGQLVSWSSRPNFDSDTLVSPRARTNFAHIMYTVARPDISADAADLYLSNSGGPDNFTYGTGESKKYDVTGALPIASVESYGSVGLADQEVGADQNWSMPVGTYLYNAMATEDHTDPTAGYSEVTHVLPAGYPVAFSDQNTPGQFIPCTPPGFLLNPVLHFASDLLAGNNFLWAKTLTTVGEQLKTKTGGYLSMASEDASSEPYQTRQDVIATETLLGHVHQGTAPVSGHTDLNSSKSPTANILGPALWKLTLSNPLGHEFKDSMSVVAKDFGKDFVLFLDPTGASGTVARPVSSATNADGTQSLVVTDVFSVGGYENGPKTSPLDAGWQVTFLGSIYTIDGIDEAPYLSDLGADVFPSKGDLNGNKFVPSHGLNAAFHAHNSSSEILRGYESGLGNIIYVPGGARHPSGTAGGAFTHRPFTTVLEGIDPDEIGQLIISDHDNVGLVELETKDGHPHARIRYDGTHGHGPDGSLTLGDSNTLNNPDGSTNDGDIPLSSTSLGADEYSTDVAFKSHNLRDIPKEIGHRSILGALEALLQGNLDGDDHDGERSFGALSNGVFYGAEAYGHLLANESSKPLLSWDGAAWNANTSSIDLTEGYFNVGGAKNYRKPTNLDLGHHGPDADVVVYYDTNIPMYTSQKCPANLDSLACETINDSPYKIPIAVVTLVGGEVETIVDIRSRISQIDKRDDITVGAGNPDTLNTPAMPWEMSIHRQGGMHFTNLGEAIAAINCWNRYGYSGRSWTIKVVGPTVEAPSVRRGITYPLKMAVSSLKIEGLGGRSLPGLENSDGVKDPIIVVKGKNSLFDLNSKSNLTFSNLSVYFDSSTDSWNMLAADIEENSVNLFVNSLDALQPLNESSTGGFFGRTNGGTYGQLGAEDRPYQSDITIENVHASGTFHSFFFHGKDQSIPHPNSPNEQEVPFDNLTIRDCSSKGGYHSFVQICPSNSLVTGNSAIGDINGQATVVKKPYYWRNINIINCHASGRRWDTSGNLWDLEDSLILDGIHLAACKEVTIRDCYITEYAKGIVFGAGNWTHWCTGTVEGNEIYNVYSDGITAFSNAYQSGIRILNNRVNQYGLLWEDSTGSLHDARMLPTESGNRYAGIRAIGHDIKIDGNSIIDARRPQGGTTRAVTMGIHLSEDLDFAGTPEREFWDIAITNNTFTSVNKGMVFLYSSVGGLNNLKCTGNICSLDAEGHPFHLANTHPVFHRIYADPQDIGEESDDAFAFELPDLGRATISDNSFHGHGLTGYTSKTSISNNSFGFPSTVVVVNGGLGLTFTGNRLNNGTVFFTGADAEITSNNFEKSSGMAYYYDIYKQADDAGDPLVYPGVFINPHQHWSRSVTGFKVTNNSTMATPYRLRDIDNDDVVLSEWWSLPAAIEIVEDSGTASKIIISNNKMRINGRISASGRSDLVINGNVVQGWFNEEDSDNVVLSILNKEWEFNVSDYATGKHFNQTLISNNVLLGRVVINGSYDPFNSFNDMQAALSTGLRPDGSDWDGIPTTVVKIPHMSNKLTGVTLSGNAIYGNVEMISLQDCVFTGNRMAGMLDEVLWNSIIIAGNNPSGVLDIFKTGQVQLVNCNRVQISSSKIASLYVAYSKMIRMNDSTVGFRDSDFDMYNREILKTLATYSPTNQGRVHCIYSPHVSVESCNLSPATLDLRMSFVEPVGTMINKHDVAVYSTMGTPGFADYIAFGDNAPLENVNRTDRDLIPVGIYSCPAFSCKNSHLSYALISASDDVMIDGNRFYGNGENPVSANSLRILESSMRPNITNNQFTANVEIGDLGSHSPYDVDDGNGGSYVVKLELPVRYPVHAHIVGNRFDSALSNGTLESNYPKQTIGGSGSLLIHNFGGSLVNGNHLLKSPWGYMMHSSDRISHESSSRWDGMSGAEMLAVAWSKVDGGNRIGGKITLDPFSSYPPENYTRSHMFHGHVDQLIDSNDQAEAFHYTHIGSGHPHIGTGSWERTLSDAPKTHHVIEGDAKSSPSGTFGLVNNPVERHLPWGGTYVFNWWSSSDYISKNAYQDFDLAGSQVLPNGTTGTTLRVYARHQYPKVLGAFVVGNMAKEVWMDERVRQSSWAYGRHCDIMVTHDNGTPVLPAQAYETPLNPLHANNHAQFNMVRHKDQFLDLAIFGNFGSYIVQSNPDLTFTYGASDSSGVNGVYTTKVNCDPWYGEPEARGRYLNSPAEPDDRYLYTDCLTDFCDPWKHFDWATADGVEVRIDWPPSSGGAGAGWVDGSGPPEIDPFGEPPSTESPDG